MTNNDFNMTEVAARYNARNNATVLSPIEIAQSARQNALVQIHQYPEHSVRLRSTIDALSAEIARLS